MNCFEHQRIGVHVNHAIKHIEAVMDLKILHYSSWQSVDFVYGYIVICDPRTGFGKLAKFALDSVKVVYLDKGEMRETFSLGSS